MWFVFAMAAVVLPCRRWAEGRNMRAFPITSLLEPLPSSPVFFLNASASASAIIINFNNPNNKTPQILAAPKRSISLPKFIRSSTSNVDLGGDDSDVDDCSSSLDKEEEEEDKSELVCGDGEYFEIEKLGENTRRIRSRIAIDATLHTIWNILTDYERLADFIPGLALSQLLHKTDNYARLFQVISLDLTIPFFCPLLFISYYYMI